ncbi:MAG: retention module-containing protein, partial [Burkholderiaceae bacterium]|nr:retention module-containing protein [Burkholderiaceae bacterium]
MATREQAVGIVKSITGKVVAIDASGNARELHAGDKVFQGEKIQSDGGAAHIDLTQGGFATVGKGLSLTLDGTILSDAAKAASETAGAGPDQPQAPQMTEKELESIQAQIAQGGDPTQLLEAAAAGPGAGGGAQEGGNFVIVNQDAARGEVTPGFETSYRSSGVGGEPLDPGAIDLFALYPATGSLTTSITGPAYENWTPNAHVGDLATSPAVLHLLFTSDVPGVSLDGYSITVPAGVQLFLNTVTDADGNQVPGTEVALVNGKYVLLPGDMASVTLPDGRTGIELDLYVKYDADNQYRDTDIDLHIEASVHNDVSGAYNVIMQDYTVPVDAVAQLPADVAFGEGPIELQPLPGEGFVPSEHPSAAPATEERTSINLDVHTLFADVDGSEAHSFILSGVPADWELTGVPGGVGMDPQTQLAADGTLTYIFHIDSTLSDVSGTITFNPGEWSNERNADGSSRDTGGPAHLTLQVSAEENPQDMELEVLNNYAISDPVDIIITVDEDKPQLWVNGTNVRLDDALVATSESVAEATVDFVLNSDSGTNTDLGTSAHLVYGASEGSTLEGEQVGYDAISADGAHHPLVWHIEGTTLQAVYADGSGVIALTVELKDAGVVFDASIGTATLKISQLLPLAHTDSGDVAGGAHMGANDTTVQLDIPITLVDSDGDPATLGTQLHIVVNDAGPSASVVKQDDSGILLTTFDSPADGLQEATAGFASAFAVQTSFGADGPGEIVLDTYALSLESGNLSNLTSHGVAIELMLDAGGDVVAHAGGAEIFRVSVDAATGEVTLTQMGPIDHSRADGSENYSTDIIALTDDLINLTRTVTVSDSEGDTDTASDTIQIGSNLQFADDGPRVEFGTITDSLVLTTFDSSLDGPQTVSGSLHQAFLDAVVVDFGADGQADTDAVVVDGFTLSVLDVVSGLTSHGVAIELTLDSGDVVGRAGGAEIFRVSVDAVSGEVTLTQTGPVDHSRADGSENYSTDITALVDGKIGLEATVTVKDYDGDTATSKAQIDLGANIQFADDGPRVEFGTITDSLVLTTFDSSLDGPQTVSGSLHQAFLGAVVVDFGADGQADTDAVVVDGFTLSVLDASSGLTSHGVAIELVLDSGDVVGRAGGVEIFRVHADAATGEITLTQSGPVDHSRADGAENY